MTRILFFLSFIHELCECADAYVWMNFCAWKKQIYFVLFSLWLHLGAVFEWYGLYWMNKWLKSCCEKRKHYTHKIWLYYTLFCDCWFILTFLCHHYLFLSGANIFMKTINIVWIKWILWMLYILMQTQVFQFRAISFVCLLVLCFVSQAIIVTMFKIQLNENRNFCSESIVNTAMPLQRNEKFFSIKTWEMIESECHICVVDSKWPIKNGIQYIL